VGGQLLVEVMSVAFNILEEASVKNGGRMRIQGMFTVADEINENGRVYKELIWDRELGKLKPLMAENRVFSEADHPDDGKSRISNTVALLTDVEKKLVEGRKMYEGEATILNTTKGRDLQEIIRAGGKVGFSSRGFGSVVKGNWQGRQADIVQEDFTLKTFDFVIGQSTKDAEVSKFFEQVDVINVLNADDTPQDKSTKGGSPVMEIKTIEELRKAYPELCLQLEKDAADKKEKEIKETMQKDFDQKVLKEVDSQKEEIKKEVIEEIRKSDDFQAMVGAFVEIGKLIKPYIGEGADEDDEGLEEKVADLQGAVETLKKENTGLKEQMDNEKKALKTKEDVKKKIDEVTAGKPHEKELVERLSDCKTVEEVSDMAAKEEAFIKKLTEGKEDPKGKGKVLNEDEQKTMDAEKKRQRDLAGIPSTPAAK